MRSGANYDGIVFQLYSLPLYRAIEGSQSLADILYVFSVQYLPLHAQELDLSNLYSKCITIIEGVRIFFRITSQRDFTQEISRNVTLPSKLPMGYYLKNMHTVFVVVFE